MTTVNVLLPNYKINLLQVNSCHYNRGFCYVSSLKIMPLLQKLWCFKWDEWIRQSWLAM